METMNQETLNLLNALITALTMEARFALSQVERDEDPFQIVAGSLLAVAASIARVKEAAQMNDEAQQREEVE